MFDELKILEYENLNTNGTKKEYWVERKTYAKNSNSINFGLITFIKASNSAPVNKLQELYLGTDIHAGYHMLNNNTIDVVILRHNVNSPLNFQVLSNDVSTKLTLASGHDFGYARLKKQNGVWNIDTNYKVNLDRLDFFYTTNHTISSSYTYPLGSRLYISDNVTLKFTGTVNLNNAEVFLGENAKIDVRDNGKIVANNTAFKRLHVNKQHKGVQLRTDNNSLYGSSVTGGQYGLYATGSHNNSITYSSFTDNEYGIYLSESDNNTLAGVDASNNTLAGLRFYKSDATIEPYYYDPPNYAPTEKIFSTFRYNGTHAIDLDAYSSVWLFESILEFNGSHDITIDASSKGYFGNHSISVDQGKNKFGNPSSPGRYIYSYAKTGTSENQTSWTVPARYNFWHNGSAPSSSEFYGSVNYSNHLTEDPTFYVPAGSLTTTDAPVAVLSASMAQAYVQPAESRVEEQKILHLQQQLAELQEKMQRDELTPLNARWLKTYRGLLQFAEAGHLKSEREQSRAFQNKWLAQFHRLTSLSADSLVELEQGVSFTDTKMNRYDPAAIRQFQKKLEAAQIVGETAVLLEVEEALQKNDFNRVHNLYGKYGSYVHNKDSQSSLLAAVSLAYQGEKAFGKALAAIEAMEEIQPDEDMMEYWEASDLEDIKSMLRDSAKVHNQLVEFQKALAKSVDRISELPQSFEVLSAYPNPFNPAAIIPFALPEDGKVKIEVFDLTGRLVSVLSNQIYKAGTHQVTFDASGLASGVYMVQVQFNGAMESQMITLIK